MIPWFSVAALASICVGLYIGFDEGLAHTIEAGSDLYLMPSLFEPSGLNQLYSLRYGTPPIVRTTGGLADTIVGISTAPARPIAHCHASRPIGVLLTHR